MIRYEAEVDPLVSLSLQNFSYSRLKSYEECPQRYFYAYVVKAPQTFGMPATLGNIIHSALETTIKSNYNFEQRDLFTNYAMAVSDHDPEYRIPSEMIDEGATMLQEFVEARGDTKGDFPHEPEHGVDYLTELPFSLIIGRGRFNGFIDNVVIKPNRVTITDYKCVTEDTKFWSADGSPVTVKDIAVGDKVWGWSSDKGMHLTEVTDVFDNGQQSVVVISTINGRNLKVTKNHPVMTRKGWKNAEKLDNTDHIMVGMNLTEWFEEHGYPEVEDVLPEPALLAEFMKDGPFSSYLMYQNDLLRFNKEYWPQLFHAFFAGRHHRVAINMTVAQDLQTMLAQIGINSHIWYTMGAWNIEIGSDSKMAMLMLMADGRLPKAHTATDRVTGVFPVGTEPTWGLTVSDNHTHITDGLVTHNSGKWETAAKRIPEDLQLGVYSLVAHTMWPDKEVYAELYYLRSGRKKGHTFSESELEAVEVKLTEKVETVLEATSFPPTSNVQACVWCSYAKDGTCDIGRKRLQKRGTISAYDG